MSYLITWPNGVGDASRVETWGDVADYITESVREALFENEQTLTEGAGFDAEGEEAGEELISTLMTQYLREAEPEEIDDGCWRSKILAEAPYFHNATTRYYNLTIREEAE